MTGDINDAIRRDLEKKLMAQLDTLIEREINLANMMLPGPELGLMCINIGVSINVALGLVIAQLAKPNFDRDQVFDRMIATIAQKSKDAKSGAFEALRQVTP